MRPRPLSQAGLRALMLAPACWWVAHRTARRMAQAGWRAPVPVVSVDSLAGGVGLPAALSAALAVIGRLQGRGLLPVVVMRADVPAPVRVVARGHSCADVGDAALLAAAFAPTWVAGDLVAGVRAACEHARANGSSPDCIVLYGAAYDPGIHKDLSIAVVGAARGFGNGLCRPAGPLPEPLAQALARVDICLSIGPPALQAQFTTAWGRAIPAPLMQGQMAALPTGMDWRGLRALAFSGAGEPGHFLAALRGLGGEVVRAVTLSAAGPLSPALAARLRREAAALRAQLVTTEADALRLPDDLRREVLVLPMRLQVADWGALDAALDHLAVR